METSLEEPEYKVIFWIIVLVFYFTVAESHANSSSSFIGSLFDSIAMKPYVYAVQWHYVTLWFHISWLIDSNCENILLEN